MTEDNKQYAEHIQIDQFQSDLISWFEREQRSLPWRESKDPYRVWVSEIMLQQTRVDTVIPYFNRFMEWFPTLEAFAEADEERILKAWEGLGYYSRVRNLQEAAREVQASYNGVVPDTPAEIASLKGVGPYTAGAVLSIAYGKPEPAVDGNVMRVLSRILLIREDIAKPKTRKTFEAAVRELIDHSNPSFFNQALMELGALICTPGNPSCLLCPVQAHCQAFAEGVQSELPVKNKKTKTRNVPLAAAILKNEDGRYLIRKRPETGLLANLWEFPNVEVHTNLVAKRRFFEEEFEQLAGVKPVLQKQIKTIQHVFSHLVWEVEAYAGTVGPIDPLYLTENRYRWADEEEMEQYAFPVPYQKIWKAYKEQEM